MINLKFFVPKDTPIHYHTQGRAYNIYHDFVLRTTDRDVHFDLADVWYVADVDLLEPDGLRPNDITRDTPEGWPAELQRSIGFKLPANGLGIDYIVVPFSAVQWSRVDAVPVTPEEVVSGAPATETADHVLRRMHQQTGGYYFPGQLPS